MRSVPLIVLLIVIFAIGMGYGQQVCPEGIKLFNRGMYGPAIDTLLACGEDQIAERGIIYYYVGESYYNLGLDAAKKPDAIQHFKNAEEYFTRAALQTDLLTLYPRRLAKAKYKKSWSIYRMAEFEANPSASLIRAANSFLELATEGSDSLHLEALYMSGESRYRAANWNKIQMLRSDNVGHEANLARISVQNLNQAFDAFQSVAGSSYRYLQACSGIRLQDVLMEWGKLYQRMSLEVFDRVSDIKKKAAPVQTAINIFNQVNYESVLSSLTADLRRRFEPVSVYASAYKYLNLVYSTTDYNLINQHLQRLKSILARNKAIWERWNAEEQFLMGSMDRRIFVQKIKEKDETFIRDHTDPANSYFARAAGSIVEARYWLGWDQFIVDFEEKIEQFDQFLKSSASYSDDPRISALREDATYRLFLSRFEQYADNTRLMEALEREIVAFQPEVQSVREDRDLLLQLVQIGLGRNIWTRVLIGTEDRRFDQAFDLIQRILLQATRVRGRERQRYLLYLNQLFEITEEKNAEETRFYRGMKLFLEGQIQESHEEKRTFFLQAAQSLESVSGDYQYEGLYIRARSYFAAAKHGSSEQERMRSYRDAQPIFMRLINTVKSLRSVFYLAEIYRVQEKDGAARRCYEVVIEKTKDNPEGSFWYNNAKAGLETCGQGDGLGDLNSVDIASVIFPENLLERRGKVISLERFADSEYVQAQYFDESADLFMKFGLPPMILYPSDHKPPLSNFARRTFRSLTAGINERMGTILSGLQIQIVYPYGIPEQADVTLDELALIKDSEGFYRKVPLTLNQVVEIRVDNSYCYPFLLRHKITMLGVERILASLVRRIVFDPVGAAVDPDVTFLSFSDRLDKNTIAKSSGQMISPETALYKDIKADIGYRDYAYSKPMDGFLVVHSDMDNLILYRNDLNVTKEGEFPLVFELDDDKVNSPEGIAVDSDGLIYIADWGSHRITIFAPDGSFMTSIGSFGTNSPEDIGSPVKFEFPTRIAITEDTEGTLKNDQRIFGSPQIFVADRHGVHYIDFNGNYLDTISPSGMRKGSFYGLAVKGYGAATELYVVNRQNNKIEKYASRAIEVR